MIKELALQDLITAVREENLSKDQLESYHLDLSDLKSRYLLVEADLKKKQALFLLWKAPEQSVADREREWAGTENGLRLIDVKGEVRVMSTLLGSVKSRLYSNY